MTGIIFPDFARVVFDHVARVGEAEGEAKREKESGEVHCGENFGCGIGDGFTFETLGIDRWMI